VIESGFNLCRREHQSRPLASGGCQQKGSHENAGHIATMGFAGTYTDEGAEFEATALVGKRSLRRPRSCETILRSGFGLEDLGI
jgi:hypothetical protein